MSKEKNVYQRIHAVMTEIETIAKTGRNTFHKYDYATEADYVKALRPLFNTHGLVVIPNVMPESVRVIVAGEKADNFLTTAVMRFTIVNIDKPEEKVEASVIGQGQDKGDKGAYKLMTGAKKYFAALTFMVATGDDSEKTEGGDKRVKVKKTNGKKSIQTSEEDDF